MKEYLTIVKLNSKYCDYLRQYDEKVPYNYKNKELRPFVGVLFSIGKIMYFAPLSSPKPKHLRLKSKLDFLKIDKGRLGAINFNNMLPVTNNNIIKIDFNSEPSTIFEAKYKSLLKEQLRWLNRNYDKIYGRSKKLYNLYVNNTLDAKIAKRCCDFKLLEEKCFEYNKSIVD